MADSDSSKRDLMAELQRSLGIHTCCFERHEDGGGYFCVECATEYVCPRLSRFTLRRDPNDGSYQAEEACEAHVADSMALLYDGEPSARIVVEMRWDGEAQPVCENRTPLSTEAAGRKPTTEKGAK